MPKVNARKVLEEVLGQLTNVTEEGDEYRAICPAHNDHNPSLSIRLSGNRILIHCFAGCSTESILQAIGLEMRKLFERDDPDAELAKKERDRITWDIKDEVGKVVANHIRVDYDDGSKSCFWMTDGQSGLNGFKTEDLPLYGLQWINNQSDKDIILVEGEKAADALHNAEYRVFGTVTGASGCPSSNSLKPLVNSNKRILLWPDNDATGKDHMGKIAERLHSMGAEISVIEWPDAPEKGDAFDYLNTNGDVNVLLESARKWEPPSKDIIATDFNVIEKRIPLLTGNSITLRAEGVRKKQKGIHATVSVYFDNTRIAYDTFNTVRDRERGNLARSSKEQLPAGIKGVCNETIFKREIDQFATEISSMLIEQQIGKPMEGIMMPITMINPYLIKGGGTILFGPPGKGKSHMLMLMAVSIDAGANSLWSVTKSKVLFINLERSEESMKRRLATVNKVLGLDESRSLLFLNAKGMALNEVAEAARATVERYGVEVILLDSISRSGMGDLTENTSANKIIDILNGTVESWIAIAHTPRNDSNHVYGSIHFEAGADIMVRLKSENNDDELEIFLKIVKANDIPAGISRKYFLEFGNDGLESVRDGGLIEFPEINMTGKTQVKQAVDEYLDEVGECTATQAANNTGFSRSQISKLFNHHNGFEKSRKEGKDQYYKKT